MRFEKITEFWKTAKSAIKYEVDSLWGLKTPNGEVVLKPKYEQIEICSDFIYAHYCDRHTFFYKNGRTCDCPDDEPSRFNLDNN